MNTDMTWIALIISYAITVGCAIAWVRAKNEVSYLNSLLMTKRWLHEEEQRERKNKNFAEPQKGSIHDTIYPPDSNL